MCMNLYCHRNLCFWCVIETYNKIDIYIKFLQTFAHKAQICPKFSCKKFQWCLPSILNTTPLYLGGHFCGHTAEATLSNNDITVMNYYHVLAAMMQGISRWLINWVKVFMSHSTLKRGHFGDVPQANLLAPRSQSLGLVWKQELIRRWDSKRELLRSAPGSYPNSLK